MNKKVLSDQEKQQLINYHKIHSDSATQKHFGLTYTNYNSTLNELGLARHSEYEGRCFRGLDKYTDEDFKNIAEYYKTHSCRNTCEYFHIKQDRLNFILSLLGVEQHSYEEARKLGSILLAERYEEKTGYKNPQQNPSVQEKTRCTCTDRYGVAVPLQNKEIKEKVAKTCISKYGYSRYSQSVEHRAWLQENSNDWLNKKIATQKANNTLNSSKPEEVFYAKLCNKFSADDILRQYTDERYPFLCDFYIKSMDLFIELNLTWTHGNRPFNSDNSEDLAKLQSWQERATKSKYYKNAIYTWTDLDVRKHDYAAKNNLNYITLYSKADIAAFLQEPKKDIEETDEEDKN